MTDPEKMASETVERVKSKLARLERALEPLHSAAIPHDQALIDKAEALPQALKQQKRWLKELARCAPS